MWGWAAARSSANAWPREFEPPPGVAETPTTTVPLIAVGELKLPPSVPRSTLLGVVLGTVGGPIVTALVAGAVDGPEPWPGWLPDPHAGATTTAEIRSPAAHQDFTPAGRSR
jgi:hypothetical protein